MSFGQMAVAGHVKLSKPGAVSKSYPEFWEHLRKAGFEVK
jgi:5-enolpyruvylshikimate-3-phosphate synthase